MPSTAARTEGGGGPSTAFGKRFASWARRPVPGSDVPVPRSPRHASPHGPSAVSNTVNPVVMRSAYDRRGVPRRRLIARFALGGLPSSRRLSVRRAILVAAVLLGIMTPATATADPLVMPHVVVAHNTWWAELT